MKWLKTIFSKPKAPAPPEHYLARYTEAQEFMNKTEAKKEQIIQKRAIKLINPSLRYLFTQE